MYSIYFYIAWFPPAFLVATFATASTAREPVSHVEAAFVDSAA
jgi:hypothetical protein